MEHAVGAQAVEVVQQERKGHPLEASRDPLAALAAHGGSAEAGTRLEARFMLWQATHDRVHLAEAKRLLDFMVDHAPPECRESMTTNIRLHREIAAAWLSA